MRSAIRLLSAAMLLMLVAAQAVLAAPAAPATKPATAPAVRKRALPPAPSGVVILQDVTFLDPGREERLDLYLPANRAPGTRSPAVVMIHGGGWVGGDKAASREFNVGTTLAQAGYVCASVNYRLDREGRWPTNLHDCKNGVRFLRAHAAKYGIDADHIGVMGGSAGGHLALMVAYTSGVEPLEPPSPYPQQSSAVRCVIDLYGITNLLTRRKTDAAGNPIGQPSQRQALLTVTADEDRAQWEFASPVSHVSPASPPTLILHGTADATVDRDQAHELAARLKEHGVPHELVMLEGIGHTFDLVSWKRKPLPRDVRAIVLQFLDTHLKEPGAH